MTIPLVLMALASGGDIENKARVWRSRKGIYVGKIEIAIYTETWRHQSIGLLGAYMAQTSNYPERGQYNPVY